MAVSALNWVHHHPPLSLSLLYVLEPPCYPDLSQEVSVPSPGLGGNLDFTQDFPPVGPSGDPPASVPGVGVRVRETVTAGQSPPNLQPSVVGNTEMGQPGWWLVETRWTTTLPIPG